MLRTLSATDLAIAVAAKAGTLSLTSRVSRFGDLAYFLNDDHGIIECHLSQAEAQARIDAVMGRVQ